MKHHTITFVLTFVVLYNNALYLLARAELVEPKYVSDCLSVQRGLRK